MSDTYLLLDYHSRFRNQEMVYFGEGGMVLGLCHAMQFSAYRVPNLEVLQIPMAHTEKQDKTYVLEMVNQINKVRNNMTYSISRIFGTHVSSCITGTS